MKYRLAKISDLENLVRIHHECGKKQKGSFMHKLGLPFLRAYYKILLNEKDSIVIIAEDEDENMYGFTSGTLSAEKHLRALKKNRLKLILTVLPLLIKSPGIFKELFERYEFVILKENSDQFGVINGPRIEYWGWQSGDKFKMSVFLFRTWLNVAYAFGVTSVKGEVDLDNNNILTIHKRLGARVMKELKLKDGRKRVIIEFVNKK